MHQAVGVLIMETMLNPTGVIVADDDPIVRGILRARLEAIHRDVLLASDGMEAIALASQTWVGLVILDIAMPKTAFWRAPGSVNCRAMPQRRS
jgi:CheY-like chemotaxis protein